MKLQKQLRGEYFTIVLFALLLSGSLQRFSINRKMAVFYTGATGIGSGPHLDFRIYDPEKGGYIDPRGFENILQVGGKPLTSLYRQTSGFGPRNTGIPGASRFHKGLDYATPENTPVEVVGGRYLTTFRDERGGIMSQYAFERDGKTYEALLLHGSPKNKVLSGAAVSNNAFAPPPTQTSTPSSEKPEPVWGGKFQGDVRRFDQRSKTPEETISPELLTSALAAIKKSTDFSGTDPVLPSDENEDGDVSRIEKALREVLSERKEKEMSPVEALLSDPGISEVERTKNQISSLAQQAMSAFKPGKSVF